MLIKLLKMAIGLVVVAFIVIAGVAFGCNPSNAIGEYNRYSESGGYNEGYYGDVEDMNIYQFSESGGFNEGIYP